MLSVIDAQTLSTKLEPASTQKVNKHDSINELPTKALDLTLDLSGQAVCFECNHNDVRPILQRPSSIFLRPRFEKDATFVVSSHLLVDESFNASMSFSNFSWRACEAYWTLAPPASSRRLTIFVILVHLDELSPPYAI